MPRSLARPSRGPVWPSWGWLDAISAADPRAPPPTGAVRASSCRSPACLVWRRPRDLPHGPPSSQPKTSLSVVNLSVASRPRGNQDAGRDRTGRDMTPVARAGGERPGRRQAVHSTTFIAVLGLRGGGGRIRLDSTRLGARGGGGGVDRWLTCHPPTVKLAKLRIDRRRSSSIGSPPPPPGLRAHLPVPGCSVVVDCRGVST